MLDKRLKLLLPSKPQSLDTIRAEIKNFIANTQYKDRSSDILLVATEACANVVRHAYAKNHKNPIIMVECAFEPDCFTITVSDKGRGLKLPESGTVFSEDGGFGLFLMQKLSDTIKCYSAPGSGTMVEATFRNPNGRFLKFRTKKFHGPKGLLPVASLNITGRFKKLACVYWGRVEAQFTSLFNN